MKKLLIGIAALALVLGVAAPANAAKPVTEYAQCNAYEVDSAYNGVNSDGYNVFTVKNTAKAAEPRDYVVTWYYTPTGESFAQVSGTTEVTIAPGASVKIVDPLLANVGYNHQIKVAPADTTGCTSVGLHVDTAVGSGQGNPNR